MPYACVKPYGEDATKAERVKSCKRDAKGKFANRTKCVYQCRKTAKAPPKASAPKAKAAKAPAKAKRAGAVPSGPTICAGGMVNRKAYSYTRKNKNGTRTRVHVKAGCKKKPVRRSKSRAVAGCAKKACKCPPTAGSRDHHLKRMGAGYGTGVGEGGPWRSHR